MRPTGYQEVWHIKVNSTDAQKAFWLRFSILRSKNGFRRISEVLGIFFQKRGGKEVFKVAVKQSLELKDLVKGDSIRIGDSLLAKDQTQGSITSRGNSIKWILQFKPERDLHYEMVPSGLQKFGIIRNHVSTVESLLQFSGTVEVNGETHTFDAAPGMKGNHFGPSAGYSWVWSHCNSFLNERGERSDAVFEGISARAKISGLGLPELSSFYLHFKGKEYLLNSVWSSIRAHSEHGLNEWNFNVHHSNLTITGNAKCSYKDFAGITLEDTDGSLLYSSTSLLSDVTLTIYRGGKMEASLQSHGNAAFEVVERKTNPYVPLLI